MTKKGPNPMIGKALGALLVGVVTFLAPPASQAAEGLVTFKVLSPDLALKAAEAALKHCRKDGYQVAVAVVDRFGVQQVMLRDRFAGPHTPSTATRKAWTAVSFRTGTVELTSRVLANPEISGVRYVEGVLVLGGGVPIEAAGSIVGGIGISGAPSGILDEACAQAGIAAIEDDIAF
jgi:uncharacterized protein GlcG (DUF336 family)